MDLVGRTSRVGRGTFTVACRRDAWVLSWRGIASMATLGLRSTLRSLEGDRMCSDADHALGATALKHPWWS
jgi:hypothetical protein